MSGVFNSKAFKAVWDDLDAETQEAIKAKARWEQMSLPGVVRGWWPEVWARVEADPRQQKSVADWETKVAAYEAGKAERATADHILRDQKSGEAMAEFDGSAWHLPDADTEMVLLD